MPTNHICIRHHGTLFHKSSLKKLSLSPCACDALWRENSNCLELHFEKQQHCIPTIIYHSLLHLFDLIEFQDRFSLDFDKLREVAFRPRLEQLVMPHDLVRFVNAQKPKSYLGCVAISKIRKCFQGKILHDCMIFLAIFELF